MQLAPVDLPDALDDAREWAPPAPALTRAAQPVHRAGAGTEIVRTVAKSFGVRWNRRAVQLLATTVEAYNTWLQGALDDRARRSWLKDDLRGTLRQIRTRSRAERALFRRVTDRLSSTPDDTADEGVLESVAFARLAVAAGVFGGEVDDEVHAALDRWAVGLGLLWELRLEPREPRALAAALRRAGVPSGSDPASAARALADAALAELRGHDNARAILARLTSEASAGLSAPRLSRSNYSVCTPTMLDGLGADAAYVPAVTELEAPDLPRGLAASFERELEQLVTTPSASLAAASRYLLRRGGKRVRPALVMLSTAACGADPRIALRRACVVEWLHQTSLVIDDVLDEAPVRRGHRTLHAAAGAPFSALVAGFLLRAMAQAAQHEPEDSQQILLECATVLADGERMELSLASEGLTSGRTEYMRIIEAKTARLFSCAATLGALAAGAPKHKVKALGVFGKQVGIAFQIVDDMLDYAGDARQLGKLPGADHASRKVTLPLLFLAEREGVSPASLLEVPFASVREAIVGSDIPDACARIAHGYLARGLDELRHLDPTEERQSLARFASRLVERSS